MCVYLFDVCVLYVNGMCAWCACVCMCVYVCLFTHVSGMCKCVCVNICVAFERETL